MTTAEPKEKANLLNDVFINQNTSLDTSLALEAFPFGSLPLQETFDIDSILPKEVAQTLSSRALLIKLKTVLMQE